MQAYPQLENPLLLVVRSKFLGMIRQFLLTVALELLCKVLNLSLKLLISLDHVAGLFEMATKVRATRLRLGSTMLAAVAPLVAVAGSLARVMRCSILIVLA